MLENLKFNGKKIKYSKMLMNSRKDENVNQERAHKLHTSLQNYNLSKMVQKYIQYSWRSGPKVSAEHEI